MKRKSVEPIFKAKCCIRYSHSAMVDQCDHCFCKNAIPLQTSELVFGLVWMTWARRTTISGWMEAQ